MSYGLIVCKSGVMYSGKILQDYQSDLKWLGLKPSSKSDICIFFSTDRINKIYFIDGTSIDKTDYNMKKKPEMDLGFPEMNLQLVRVKGGISYRGERIESIPNNLGLSDGMWLATSLKQEIVVYIPHREIEKVYPI